MFSILKNPIKFAVKYNNDIYKSLIIKRISNGILLIFDLNGFHYYYPKDGKVHATINLSKSKTKEVLNNNPDLRVEKKGKIVHVFFDTKMPYLNEIDKAYSLGTFGTCVGKRYTNKDDYKSYTIVDLDEFKCKNPNTFVFITPPNYDISKLGKTHRGKTKVIDCGGLCVVLRFIDAFQPI